MKQKETIDCTVLMAGPYPFKVGKRIHVRKEGKFYYASSEGKDFGLLKEIGEDENDQKLSIPNDFNGIVVSSEWERHQLTLRVPVCRNESYVSL